MKLMSVSLLFLAFLVACTTVHCGCTCKPDLIEEVIEESDANNLSTP